MAEFFIAEDVDKLREQVIKTLEASGLPDDACLMAVESVYIKYDGLATAMHASDDKTLTSSEEEQGSELLEYAAANETKERLAQKWKEEAEQ